MAEQPKAAPKKVKRYVKHPKLNLRVNGKLQRVPVGTELTLTEKQAEAYGDKVVENAETLSIDVG